MSSLTPKEVADLLKITTNTVYEMVKRGELNAYRIGRKMRIELSEVERYKRRSSTDPISEPSKNLAIRPGLIICGNDIILDNLVKKLEFMDLKERPYRSYLSSYNGIFALYNGEVSLATAHLWDGDDDTYNYSYIKKMMPGVRTVGIHLACRTQGFYVKAGNPKNILSFEDLKRKDIRMVNREAGSGVRVLIDENLKKLKIYGSDIKGYDMELKSDIATASAVVQNIADVAVGKEIACKQVDGLDFIPLQEEEIALVFREEDENKKNFRLILDILKSKEFKNEVEMLGGYKVDNMGKEIFRT